MKKVPSHPHTIADLEKGEKGIIQEFDCCKIPLKLIE